MALVSMRQLLDHAAENNYGVPAFNVNNLEQVQAIMEAASETASQLLCKHLPAPENMLVNHFLDILSWLPSNNTLIFLS